MSLNLPKQGLMLVLSSPSGGGKSSLAKALLKIEANLHLSISATTRPMRPGEIEGVNYYFKTYDEFENLIKSKKFIEYASIYGNYYGTLQDAVYGILETGVDVLFDIDWQGARNIKFQNPETVVTVFILPPDMEILKSRIILRAEDSDDSISNRLQSAPEEMSHAEEYDYVIINDNFDLTLTKIQHILNAERSRTFRLDGLRDFLSDAKK